MIDVSKEAKNWEQDGGGRDERDLYIQAALREERATARRAKWWATE